MRTVKTSTWWDEHLTADNVEFLKREVTQEYNELTAAQLNPLKDEPWPRHQWEEGECWIKVLDSGVQHLLWV